MVAVFQPVVCFDRLHSERKHRNTMTLSFGELLTSSISHRQTSKSCLRVDRVPLCKLIAVNWDNRNAGILHYCKETKPEGWHRRLRDKFSSLTWLPKEDSLQPCNSKNPADLSSSWWCAEPIGKELQTDSVGFNSAQFSLLTIWPKLHPPAHQSLPCFSAAQLNAESQLAQTCKPAVDAWLAAVSCLYS